MAEALARGFIAKGVIKADMVHCTDPVLARREVFESFGAKSENSNLDVSVQVSHSHVQQAVIGLQHLRISHAGHYQNTLPSLAP